MSAASAMCAGLHDGHLYLNDANATQNVRCVARAPTVTTGQCSLTQRVASNREEYAEPTSRSMRAAVHSLRMVSGRGKMNEPGEMKTAENVMSADVCQMHSRGVARRAETYMEPGCEQVETGERIVA